MQMGDLMRDQVSGFEGIATGKAQYINGCVKWLLEGKIRDDGKMPTEWFDEQRVVVVTEAAFIVPLSIEESPPRERTALAGGPMPLAPRA